MNELEKRLFRNLCQKINRVLIGQTGDTKEPTITFFDEKGKNFATLWLIRSKTDDTATIKHVSPY